MGRQSSVRKLAMQLLYQYDLRTDASRSDINELYLTQSRSEPETQSMASKLALRVWDKVSDIDVVISEFSTDWSIDRLTLIDKSILRLAVYELKFTELPKAVVLNEAVTLANQFSSDESPKFINGVLGGYLDHVQRINH